MDPQALHTAALHISWERYCQLAATVAMWMEYFITIDKEVDLFWLKRWSFGKVMFIWSRYYGLVYNTVNAVVFVNPRPSLELCAKFFLFQNTGATIQVITTHIILEMRLYAMYESSKKLLILFICLTLGEIGGMAYVFNAAPPGAVQTNEPVPGLLMCDDADPPNQHFISYYYSITLISESIFLCLALYRAYTSIASGVGGRIIRTLTRDSVRYFFAILGVYLLNQVIWIHNDITLNEMATGFGLALASVLGNRLLMNIREVYYFKGAITDTTIATPMAPIDFKNRSGGTGMGTGTLSSTDTGPMIVSGVDYHWSPGMTVLDEDDEIELRTFSEARGF